jgi:hypothetical protein
MRREYDKVELMVIFNNIIENNLTHEHYKRTVDLAKFCHEVMDGVNSTYLLKYRKSETPEDELQRDHVTNSRTQYIMGKVRSVFSEIKRVDNIVDNIEFGGDIKDDAKENHRTEIRRRLNDFYEGGSLKKWLDDAYEHFNFYDPNAYGVYEFVNYSEIDKDIWIFPLVYKSEDIVYQKYDNGDLSYLVTKEYIVQDVAKYDKKEVNKKYLFYRMYAKGWAFTLEEINPTTDTEIGEILKLGTKKYLFREYETKTEVTPAFRMGYVLDSTTNNHTCLPVYWSAEKLLKDLIITKSEYDLAKFLHGFLQKFAFFPECDYKSHENEVCQGGIMNRSKTNCPSCQGKGVKYHQSVQDIIIIPEPDLELATDGKYIPLNQRIHYQEIPKHIIDGLKQDVKDLEADVLSAVFNSHVFSQNEVVKTAFEKGIELRSVYNTLSDYGDGYSERYKLGVSITGGHLLIENVIPQHRFPADFKFKDLVELLNERKTAIEAKVPGEIVDAIDKNIIKKLYADDELAMLKIDVRQSMKPYRYTTETELAIIFEMTAPNDPTKLLYLFFDEIMDEIEIEYPLYFMLKKSELKKLIDKKAVKYSERIAAPQTADVPEIEDETETGE